MASVYSKRKILYLAWYEKTLSGERIRRAETLNLKDTRENRKLANIHKKKKENMLMFSNNKVQQDITVGEGYEKFIETKSENAKSTKDYYEYSLQKLLAKYGSVSVAKIREEEIDEIEKEYSGLSEGTKISYKKGMKIFFNYLLDKKYITENPVGKIKRIRNRKIVVMTDEELREILLYFRTGNKDHYNLIKFLVLSGFRISEAVGLEWNDIKKDHIVVRNQKGKRKDYFPLTELLSIHLETIERKGERVFNYKQVTSTRHLGRQITKITEGRHSFHSFRKKFGTEWSRNLMPAELKEIMRHNDIRTTMEYYVGLNIIKIGEKMAVAKRARKR